MLAKYEWISTDKQFFGQPNTAYDFEAADMKEVSRRLAKMQEQKVCKWAQCYVVMIRIVTYSGIIQQMFVLQDKLGKSVNMRAMNMLGKAEEKVCSAQWTAEIFNTYKWKIYKTCPKKLLTLTIAQTWKATTLSI